MNYSTPEYQGTSTPESTINEFSPSLPIISQGVGHFMGVWIIGEGGKSILLTEVNKKTKLAYLPRQGKMEAICIHLSVLGVFQKH